MTTSLITQKKIAKAFKQLLLTKSFDKISVVDIMQQAGIRRQTFYNYFLDKYELLDWIFETELEEQITDNLSYINGFKLLEELLYYIEKNHTFYKQLFDIKGQNDFVSYLEGYFTILLTKIITEYQEQVGTSFSEKERDFFIRYHSSAWIGLIKEGLTTPPYHIHSYWKPMVAIIRCSLSIYRS
ncbi:dihydroxyacetone kinase transcriptional activator DhaS [Streptococcus sp. zg-JUN1979]|uniref:dihydroxyacetone kinase transcriptional activator DhaS n=1 Tax=Streptococcus sp. zg-JUN1979 TaxID=3391450 RepID=UPI0039B0F667